MRAADDPPEIVVVDASIVVALVASRSDAAAAATRLGGTAMHAPWMLPVEVDSGLRRLVLGGRLTPAQGAAARASAQGLPIELWPWSLVSERAWELRENLSTYDAGYAALAEHLQAPLITGDARIARSPGLGCRVEVIS